MEIVSIARRHEEHSFCENILAYFLLPHFTYVCATECWTIFLWENKRSLFQTSLPIIPLAPRDGKVTCIFTITMPSRRETINTLRPRQDGRHFVEDIFECIFLNENVWISLDISPKFVPMVRINKFPALVQIMAWRWPGPGDKPLSEPVMVSLVTYICVTRPQWVDQTRESGEQSDNVSVKAENSHNITLLSLMGLSLWQPLKAQAATMLSSWWPLRFSVYNVRNTVTFDVHR